MTIQMAFSGTQLLSFFLAVVASAFALIALFNFEPTRGAKESRVVTGTILLGLTLTFSVLMFIFLLSDCVTIGGGV